MRYSDIVKLQFNQVQQTLAEMGITMEASDEAL
jgi:ATP-dependent Clp protease ATP-binding subunit ClpB